MKLSTNPCKVSASPKDLKDWMIGTEPDYYETEVINGQTCHFEVRFYPNTSFPVNVTGAGTDGKIMSMGHIHSMEDTAQYYDTSVMNHAGYGIGIMYMVIFNSGKNTTGLNSHFSQNHVSHP